MESWLWMRVFPRETAKRCAQTYRPYVDKKVVFGIRPEDIQLLTMFPAGSLGFG